MDYIKFGEYPQTIKAQEVVVTDTCDERGYFVASDGCFYAKVKATPHEADFKFSTGETIIAGETYYFKVEPICWRVLENKRGNAFILCENAIASHRFAQKSNNYAQSEIRQWLNDDFLNKAFSPKEQKRILVTNVDNSVASTGYKENEYACEDTQDKVFLMSHADITKMKYGFCASYSEDKNRMRVTSDYCRATGAHMVTEWKGYGNGYWWLRSPGDAKSFARVRAVFGNGVSSYSYYYPDGDYGSVVPAMWIKF
ncbi:MAG: hypothetical protein IJV77_03545 [Clostridia bacterium]|nr:hypothetical protein [Clostridia bacterium]